MRKYRPKQIKAAAVTGIALLFMASTAFARQDEFFPNAAQEALPVQAEKETLSALDLSYWFRGINEAQYAKKIHEAALSVPTTGKGYCASWVSYVYQKAGLGFIGGNACDMWGYCCVSSDTRDIREGMLIAVPTSPGSELGRKYGHVGILLKNPNYKDPSLTASALEREAEHLKKELEKSKDKLQRIQIRTKLNGINEQIISLTQNNYYVKGHLIEVDTNGNEKWIVAENIGSIRMTALSAWIRSYDLAGKVAWGWGHDHSGVPIVWNGDLPETVAFVVHEDEEETEEEETSEEETTQEETEKESREEKQTEKEKEESSEKETTAKQEETTAQQETTKEEVIIREEAQPETQAQEETTAYVEIITEPQTQETITEPEIETTTVYIEETTIQQTEPEPIYEEPVTEEETTWTEPEIITEPETEPVYVEPETELFVPEETAEQTTEETSGDEG